MASLAPQSESVLLANEAVTLPLEQATRRSQLIWRLDGIVRREPSDLVARTGLSFCLVADGQRTKAHKELDELFTRRSAADSTIRHIFARALACVGRLEEASTVLRETIETFPDAYLGKFEESIAAAGLFVGDVDFFRRAMDPADSAATDTLALIENNGLEVPIRLLAASLAETICKEARAARYLINADEKHEIDGLDFIYRAPLAFKERWRIEGDCLKIWRAKLKDAGLRWADCAPFLNFSLEGFPTEDQAAA